MPLPVGTALQNGDYVLDAISFQDDSSTLYQATHIPTGQRVAVRLLEGHWPQAAWEEKNHFIQHVQHLAQQHHPHIISHLHSFEDHGHLFVVSDWGQGIPLAKRLTQSPPLNEATALTYIHQIASALNTLRTIGLQQIDLHPRRMLCQLTPDQIVLTGIGCPPSYLIPHQSPPEQDVLALAYLLYQMVTGDTDPFISEAWVERLQAQPLTLTTQQALQTVLGRTENQRPLLEAWLNSLKPNLPALPDPISVDDPVQIPSVESEATTAISAEIPVDSHPEEPPSTLENISDRAIATSPLPINSPPLTPLTEESFVVTADASVGTSSETPTETPTTPTETPTIQSPDPTELLGTTEDSAIITAAPIAPEDPIEPSAVGARSPRKPKAPQHRPSQTSPKRRFNKRYAALLMTALVASVSGVGFGAMLRFMPNPPIGQNRLNPEQSFPPLSDWPIDHESEALTDFDQPYYAPDASPSGQPSSYDYGSSRDRYTAPVPHSQPRRSPSSFDPPTEADPEVWPAPPEGTEAAPSNDATFDQAPDTFEAPPSSRPPTRVPEPQAAPPANPEPSSGSSSTAPPPAAPSPAAPAPAPAPAVETPSSDSSVGQ